MSEFLKVGDVFKAASLANANFHHIERGEVDRKRVVVGGTSRLTACWTEASGDGWTRERREAVDLSGYDHSRGEAEFVVLRTQMSGGGYAQGNDYYHPGWNVEAKRLTAEGEYDPDGESVSFYQSGSFTSRLDGVVKTRFMDLAFVGIVTERLAAASPKIFLAARELIESSYEHDDKDGRGPNICVSGYDLDVLKQALSEAEEPSNVQ
jgi:hypothetical protein